MGDTEYYPPEDKLVDKEPVKHRLPLDNGINLMHVGMYHLNVLEASWKILGCPMRYHYVYISDNEFQFFEEGNVPTNYVLEEK